MFGRDPCPTRIEANRPTLEALVQYFVQYLGRAELHRQADPDDDLFVVGD